MRKLLDRLYGICVAAAAIMIAGICLLVTAQVLANIITKFGGRQINLTIPSYADFAGYMLAAASFMALAYTLRTGRHIRVTLITGLLPDRVQFALELLTVFMGVVISGVATFYMAHLCIESFTYNDMSPGIIAVPIYLPQIPVAFGLAVLTIAFIDTFVETLRAGRPVIETQEM